MSERDLPPRDGDPAGAAGGDPADLDGDPAPAPVELTLTVGAEEEGQRLDAFLAARCPEYSRSRIHQDLQGGGVAVQGRPRPKSFRLRAGQEVVYRPVPRPQPAAVPQDLPLQVVFRDEHLLVIDKAVGMVVHPAAGHPDGTVVNAVLHLLGERPAAGEPLRPGIVHRLDRDTSGLLCIALSELAHQRLTAQLQARTLGRTYLALSWGRWAEPAGVIEGNIGRDPRHRQRMAVVARGGRPAVTRYEVLEDFGFVQYCRVNLETGRTHQIRVHFAHRRHPVVGDPLYGDDRRARGLQGGDRQQAERLVKAAGRQLLHAAQLRLEHPADGRLLEFTAPVPADLAAALAGLRA